MEVLIVGGGKMGSAMALRLAKIGYNTTLAAYHPMNVRFRKQLAKARVIITDFDGMPRNVDTIIIALRPEHLRIIQSISDNFSGIVIDASNSYPAAPQGFKTNFEYISSYFKNAKITKCFNVMGYENILNPVYEDQRADMVIAGDDLIAVQKAQELSLELGFGNCYHLGGDEAAELLENIAKFWLRMSLQRRMGRDIAFKFLKR